MQRMYDILFCGKIVGTSLKQRKNLQSKAATHASRAKSTDFLWISSNIIVAHVEFHCQSSSNVHVKTAKVRYLPYLSSIMWNEHGRFEDNSIPKLCASSSAFFSSTVASHRILQTTFHRLLLLFFWYQSENWVFFKTVFSISNHLNVHNTSM